MKNKSLNVELSSFLVNFHENLKKGKLLDLASGTGLNSNFMIENDYEVESLNKSLDFYLAPIQKYDSTIIIDYKCSARLLEEVKKGLVIGGTLLIEAYTTEHIKYNPETELVVEDCYKPFELSRLIKGWNMLYYDERVIDKCYKVKAILSKPSY